MVHSLLHPFLGMNVQSTNHEFEIGSNGQPSLQSRDMKYHEKNKTELLKWLATLLYATPVRVVLISFFNSQKHMCILCGNLMFPRQCIPEKMIGSNGQSFDKHANLNMSLNRDLNQRTS